MRTGAVTPQPAYDLVLPQLRGCPGCGKSVWVTYPNARCPRCSETVLPDWAVEHLIAAMLGRLKDG